MFDQEKLIGRRWVIEQVFYCLVEDEKKHGRRLRKNV